MNNLAKKYAISELNNIYAFLIENSCHDEKILSQIDELQNAIDCHEEQIKPIKEKIVMDRTNRLILMLATFQASILVNANAYDDDKESTWQELKEDYEALKTAIDKYIELGEKD